jgi:hypothetical protein
MQILKAANLALSFLLELCLLAALGSWGFRTGTNTISRILLGIGSPLLAALIWGIFLAPKSTRRLRGLALELLKILIFALAVAALYVSGQSVLALIFGLAVALNLILAWLWKQEMA